MTEPTFDRELFYEALSSGDRNAVIALGVYGAEAIKQSGVAIFMVDALGRVQIMPPQSIQILARPVVIEEDLDKLSEETAITVMSTQGDNEDRIVEYLKNRKAKEATSGTGL